MIGFSTRRYFEQFHESAIKQGYNLDELTTPTCHTELRSLVEEVFEQTYFDTPQLTEGAEAQPPLDHFLEKFEHSPESLKAIARIALCSEASARRKSLKECCEEAEPRLIQTIKTSGNWHYSQPIIVTDANQGEKPVGVIKRYGEDTMYSIADASHAILGRIAAMAFYDVGDVKKSVERKTDFVPLIDIKDIQTIRICRPSTFIFPPEIRSSLSSEWIGEDEDINTRPALETSHEDLDSMIKNILTNVATRRVPLELPDSL